MTPIDSGRRIFGVDFSGAEAAGRTIWIAAGRATSAGLKVERCFPGWSLPGSAVARSACLAALVRFIADQRDSAFGLDFPFSVAAPLIGETSWRDYTLGFTDRYPTAEAFRQACRAASGGRELKRVTDRTSKVPFAAYNLRLYRQTYHGIGQVLAPLVRDRAASVLPMQAPAKDRPWLFEICPASTLKATSLYPSYKGRSAAHRAARRQILQALVARGALIPLAPALATLVIEDAGGDALDSVIAAVATLQALGLPAAAHCPNRIERVEGRVYFEAIGAGRSSAIA